MGYLFYQYCPMDYCHSPITELDLNIQNGSDAQCALNRTGLLCGSCQAGFSLSLGSSRCLMCQDDWPVMFVTITLAGILAGIVLCIIILILNLTVAVGTINGVIFYANILAASYSTFLPKNQPNPASIFISMFNLELGFDACYLKGMDAYTKTWLQFAFPLYVFVLVLYSNHKVQSALFEILKTHWKENPCGYAIHFDLGIVFKDPPNYNLSSLFCYSTVS